MADVVPAMPPPAVPGADGSDMAPPKTSISSCAFWFGDYDYARLCLPRLPCLPSARRSRSIFFGLDDKLPVLLAALMGFQHALAMIGGIITIPRILSGPGAGHLNLDSDVRAYLISTSLTVSGLMSIIQIVRIRLVKGYWIGTGLISMSGTSFTFLPVAEETFKALYNDGLCEPNTACPEAYGKWLGTVMVGALLEIALSFVPPSVLRRLFPPIVTGSTVLLIGSSLIGVGLRYWAGGAGPCLTYSNIVSLAGEENVPEGLLIFKDCPNIFGPGDRHYPWGAAQWIGLGFFVFSIIILVELFGSPFMRNAQVVIGLICGIILCWTLGYMDKELIVNAPAFTLPLFKRFPLGFYAPALIPILIAYLVSTVETIGDITASSEVSRVETEGPQFESRIQGGLLADGINSLVGALLTSNPTTTFSQNNGVIAMTRTANRSAGLWGAAWLIVFGVIGKLGGVFVALPDAALGGMTTFLFASVAVSGIKVLSTLEWTRRDRFILAITLSLGLGVTVVPAAFTKFIPQSENTVLKALRDGVVIILTTGYSIGAIAALLLNILLPTEEEAVSPDEFLRHKKGDDSNDDVPTEPSGTSGTTITPEV